MSTVTDNETDLIRRAQADDANAFCSLAERYARRIYLLAFHYCRNTQDAEDLSQEVWLRAYQALAGFRAESSFYTWLRRITINAFLNHQRTSTFRHQGQTTIVELIDSDSETAYESRSASAETVYTKVLFETVMTALGELTPSQRLMFLLRHYEGMSYDEIAAAMNCSPGTVKKGVSRAIAKLRVKLDTNTDEPERLTRLVEC
ncbi:MAG TPA: sigma-70 family RNA polymerase sigma factor [Pyrinomonadaceae bacterium]|jgi:RNA polymerase sigma-70 factor (ECF subfamily)|nr:sigma-70 family RNA polymerase sigma factor [Pyrinomonadaceae bacterium]